MFMFLKKMNMFFALSQSHELYIPLADGRNDKNMFMFLSEHCKKL